MIASLLLLLSVQAAQASDARLALPTISSASVRDSLEAAELRFFHEWGIAYRLSKATKDSITLKVRTDMATCPWAAVTLVDSVVRVKAHAVSTTSVFGRCPTWNLGPTPFARDERHSVDAALDEGLLPGVTGARASLITVFARAVERFPWNDWMIGQLVRLRVDQHDLNGVLADTRACRATRWWCLALSGYALALRDSTVVAERAFDEMMQAMPPETRCAWSDVSMLLDDSSRAAYLNRPCDERPRLSESVWWLSDPLWSRPGNERRVEHFARQVFLALRVSLDRDERWSWVPDAGGREMRELVLRYGWPSYTAWAGEGVDDANSGRLIVAKGAPNTPYTTFEYSAGRLHVVPASRAVLHPVAAVSSDWTLGESRQEHPGVIQDSASLGSFRTVAEQLARTWWPSEHFASALQVTQLGDPLVRFLRRQHGAILATALTLDASHDESPTGDTLSAQLIVTAEPHAFHTIQRTRARVGEPVALFGAIDSTPSVVGIEFGSADSASTSYARTRFGMTPDPPLSRLRPGEKSISTPILLRVPSTGGFPHTVDDILPWMASSDTVREGTRGIGLYWETYGFSTTDTVQTAIWLERFTPQGLFRELGIALKVAPDLNTPVAVSWTERGVGPNVVTLPGPVPIAGRTLLLNTTNLHPGEYWLEVVANTPGTAPLRSRMKVTVVGK